MTAAQVEERVAVTEYFPVPVRRPCLVTFGYPRHAKKPLAGLYRGMLVVDGTPRRLLVDTKDGVTRFVETQHVRPLSTSIEGRDAA